MAKQEFIPGAYFSNETGSRQFFVPGYSQLNDTVNNYSDSFTESVTAAHSQTIAASIVDTTSDSVTASDSEAFAWAYYYSEAFAAADSLTAAASIPISTSDSITASDAILSVATPRQYFIPGMAEINEVAVRQYFIPGYGQVNATSPYYGVSLSVNQSPSESVTAAHSQTVTTQASITVFENGTTGDSYSVSNAITQTQSESVTSSDSLTAVSTFNNTVTENVTGADSFSAANTITQTQSESVTAADSAVSGFAFAAAFTDSVAAASGYTTASLYREQFIDGGYQVNESGTTQYFVPDHGQINETSPYATIGGVSVDHFDAVTENLTGADSLAAQGVFRATLPEGVTADANFSPTYAYRQFFDITAAISESGTLQYFLPDHGQVNETSPYGLVPGSDKVRLVSANITMPEGVTAASTYASRSVNRQFFDMRMAICEGGARQYFVPDHGQINDTSPIVTTTGEFFQFRESPQESIAASQDFHDQLIYKQEMTAWNTFVNETGSAQYFIPGGGIQINETSPTIIRGVQSNVVDRTFDIIAAYDAPIVRQLHSAAYGSNMFGAVVYGLAGASISVQSIPVSVNFVQAFSEGVTAADDPHLIQTYGVTFVESITALDNLAVFDWRRNPHRTFPVDPILTSFISQGSAVNRVVQKTPNERDYITVDYVNLLDIDNITGSTWTADSPMTVDTPSYNGSIVQAWFAAGAQYGTYDGANTATTQGGRTLNESIQFNVLGHNYITDLIIAQAPTANVDYSLDWALRMKGDTIASSLWYAEGSDNALSVSFNTSPLTNLPTSTLVYITGGTVNQGYAVTNRITTTSGRVLEASFKVFIRQNVLQ